MRAINLKNLISVTGLGLAMISGTAVLANAQGRDRTDNKRQVQIDKVQQKRESDLAKANQQRERADQERAKAEQDRLRLEQQRQADKNRHDNDNRNNNGNWNNNSNWNNNGNWNSGNSNRFRIYRNGSFYDTDRRGSDLLRQAVNAGYQQGFEAGRNDRNSRRRMDWVDSNIYRSGSFGYQSYVDRGQYQYYFQQGFQRGYQDGYNSRYQFGSYNGGTLQVIGSILDSILDIRSY